MTLLAARLTISSKDAIRSHEVVRVRPATSRHSSISRPHASAVVGPEPLVARTAVAVMAGAALEA